MKINDGFPPTMISRNSEKDKKDKVLFRKRSTYFFEKHDTLRKGQIYFTKKPDSLNYLRKGQTHLFEKHDMLRPCTNHTALHQLKANTWQVVARAPKPRSIPIK